MLDHCNAGGSGGGPDSSRVQGTAWWIATGSLLPFFPDSFPLLIVVAIKSDYITIESFSWPPCNSGGKISCNVTLFLLVPSKEHFFHSRDKKRITHIQNCKNWHNWIYSTVPLHSIGSDHSQHVWIHLCLVSASRVYSDTNIYIPTFLGRE